MNQLINNQDSDYDKAVHETFKIPKLYIGQEVKTKHGTVGIIVKITMDHNGLYIRPETTKVTVWFGTEKADKWVKYTYDYTDVEPVTL